MNIYLLKCMVSYNKTIKWKPSVFLCIHLLFLTIFMRNVLTWPCFNEKELHNSSKISYLIILLVITILLLRGIRPLYICQALYLKYRCYSLFNWTKKESSTRLEFHFFPFWWIFETAKTLHFNPIITNIPLLV